MGMEYMKIVRRGAKASIVIESEMWVFLVLVVTLLIITLASYFAFTRHKQMQMKNDLINLQWRKRFSW